MTRASRYQTTAFAAIATVAGGLDATARADFIWDGGALDDFFTTDVNWVGDVAPPTDLDGDNLVFGSNGGFVESPDVAGDDYINIMSLSFTGSDESYTITDTVGGGSLQFSDGGSITQDSALFDQTIDVDLVGTGDDLFITADTNDLMIGARIFLSDSGGVMLTVDGAGDTTVDGAIIGGGGSILKQGAGNLTLNGVNTYGGGTELNAGTITVGDDSALGNGGLAVTGDASIASNTNGVDLDNSVTIDDMVTLTFTGDRTLRLSGVLSGDGGLTVDATTDTTTLELTAANTYTGDTRLKRGTVGLGNNQALGTGDVRLNGDVTLITLFNANRFITNQIRTGTAGHTLTIGGQLGLRVLGKVSGQGSVVIDMDDDTDRVTLGAANTYTGGTTLTQGTLVVGDDDALGTGDLTLAGDGSLASLDDDLAIGNDVVNGGFELTFTGDFDLALDGAIMGTGGLTVESGDSVLRLDGISTYTGATTVNSGSLFVNGRISSSVTVNDGGTLGGTGTVAADVTAEAGGTVAPGESIGILKIEGNYLNKLDGILLVELNADNLSSDRLNVTGTATLEADSIIRTSLATSGYVPSNQTFAIIDADGGVTDMGAMLEADSASATVQLVIDPAFTNGDNQFNLQLVRAADAYAAAASPGNNRAIGNALDSTVAIANAARTGPAAQLLAQLDLLGSTDYNTAVSQLSPETYNAVAISGFESSREFVTEQVNYLALKREGIGGFDAVPQFATPLPGSLVLAADDPLLMAAAIAQAESASPPAGSADKKFTSGEYFKIQGVFVTQDTTSTETGFDSHAFGGQAGFDWDIGDEFVLGAAVGYLYTDVNLDLGLGANKVNSIRGGPYASWTRGNWYVDGSATFAWHWYNSNREIPSLGLTADGKYTGYDVTGYLGGGYRWEMDRNLWLTPMMSMLYSHYEFDSFQEAGAGGANLAVSSRSADSFQSRLGAALAYRIESFAIKPIPYAYIGWQHEFLDDNTVDASFATGGSPFQIDTGARPDNAVYFGFGLNVLVKPNVSAFFRFESVQATNVSASAAAGGVSIAF